MSEWGSFSGRIWGQAGSKWGENGSKWGRFGVEKGSVFSAKSNAKISLSAVITITYENNGAAKTSFFPPSIDISPRLPDKPLLRPTDVGWARPTIHLSIPTPRPSPTLPRIPMAIASLTNIEKHFGKNVLFEKLDLTIYEGERVGFIRRQWLGQDHPFQNAHGSGPARPGHRGPSANRPRWDIWSRTPTFNLENTVIDEAELGFAELHDLSHKMRELEHKMAEVQGDALEKGAGEISGRAARL